MTQEGVEEKQTSTEEQVSTTTEVEEKTETQVEKEEPLTIERVQQMIAESRTQAIEEGKQFGRKELQGQQDRNRAELSRVERRAKTSADTLGAVRRQFQDDPETAKEIELAELRAERQGRTSLEQEEEQRRGQEEFHNTFIATQTQIITDAGVDPKDQRIDWAGDAPNYLEAMRRIQASVGKIQKENTQTVAKGLEDRLKELEDKLAKVNVEVNSVEAGASAGAIAGSDAEFVKQFGNYEIPDTKVNRERYAKILEQS